MKERAIEEMPLELRLLQAGAVHSTLLQREIERRQSQRLARPGSSTSPQTPAAGPSRPSRKPPVVAAHYSEYIKKIAEQDQHLLRQQVKVASDTLCLAPLEIKETHQLTKVVDGRRIYSGPRSTHKIKTGKNPAGVPSEPPSKEKVRSKEKIPPKAQVHIKKQVSSKKQVPAKSIGPVHQDDDDEEWLIEL